MKLLVFLTVAISLAYAPSGAQVPTDSTHAKHHMHENHATTDFEIPSSLKEEHDELHLSLVKFTKLPGKTGAAAKELASVLHPHFVKEEKYALPILGLLPALAEGKASDEMKPAIAMADTLKQEFQQMISEHKDIVVAVEKLHKAAKAEKRTEVVRFTEELKLHAKTEEEILYPTAILIGEYLKLRLFRL